MKLSKRITDIKPSAAVELDRILSIKKQNGEEFISLNAGQPDFNTPDNIVKACNLALTKGKTKYTSVNGIIELREAVCKKLLNDNGIPCSPEDIVVTTGAKQALFNAIQVIADKGDEIIIPTPCWVSYTEMVKLAQAIPVPVPTNCDYHLDFSAIEKAITHKTKAIIINNPCNPTGAVYSESELRKLAELAVRYNFYIISDEVYEKLIYDNNRHFSIASVSKDVKDLCITVNGFSKAYSMTGWRIGYLSANSDVVKGVCALQSHTTSNSTTFVQWAAVEALNGPQESVEIMRREFESRRNFVYEFLSNTEGFKLSMPQGAFYVFPDISSYFGSTCPNGEIISNSSDFCLFLLNNAKVAVLPGKAFGNDDCIRIAYSNSMENLKTGLNNIKNSILQLKL